MAASAVLRSAPAPILAAKSANDSRPSTSQGLAAKPLGPTSKVYTIPPRARPGRRPISGDNSSDRRKLQNRESQRAYRDRRADRVKDLEQNIETATRQHRDASTAWMVEKHRLQTELHDCHVKMQAMRDEIKARDVEYGHLLAKLEQQSTSSASLTAPADKPAAKKQKTVHESARAVSNHDDMEIDFTNMFPSRVTAPSAAALNNAEHEDSCGFCTDDQNCACRETFETAAREEAEEAARAAAAETAQKGKLMSASQPAVSGPGTCDQCRADPERARQCQELARFARIEPSLAVDSARQTRGSAKADAAPQLQQPQQPIRLPPITVSCADFLGQIPRPLHPAHESTTSSSLSALPYGEMFGRLRAYPYFRPSDPEAIPNIERQTADKSNGTESAVQNSSPTGAQSEAQHLPAFSIDATEAAVVLASLSKSEVKK